ncbi:PqqD family protein [Streptomyces coeruleorubidus]
MAAELARRHEIPPEQAEQDVQAILARLSSAGLVVAS